MTSPTTRFTRARIRAALRLGLDYLLHGDPVKSATRDAVAAFVAENPSYGPYFDYAYGYHFSDTQIQRLLKAVQALEAAA